ncbi:MAG: elongation factor P [Armatimonadetes bacterium CG_4_10_14_0_8_um_filter_66_14]|nr:elongation factor P [Armatimonadota bacterium]PIX46723.1 MAG: elongation factor P [Armatimonadetes bacterium CG_4_8_14_3_um_filter_66_20]PIZ40872.1 MAG: elongation factor P [Armatimonadetes bacterium CG_4_10_14_0_8_um_filter_66_14]NCO92643.1 elongation factor P [Armatimonadota bacterium]NCP28862.1 elongation factor P [Armatimonadota bacterium]
MAISTADFKNGLTIEIGEGVFQILGFQHVKPGKGGAFVRSRLRNLETGNTLEKTFRAGEKMERAHVERGEVEYLYREGEGYVFMDMSSYEQTTLSKDELGDAANYLKDNMPVQVITYKGKVFGVEVPAAVELQVVHTEPGLKGDTAQGGTKPATLETGLIVQVPLFIEQDEVIKVDTRNAQYLERAK